MRATGYVGMTLAVLGLLLCLTGYGLALAFLLLVPAIILCHRAARTYRAESNKTHGGLIVLLVLSYIGSGLGIAVWVFVIYQNQQNAVHTSSYAVTTKDQTAAAPIADEAPRKQARIALESNDAPQFQAALASLDTARKNENSIEEPYVKSYAAEFGDAGQNALNSEVETRMKDYRAAGKAGTGER